MMKVGSGMLEKLEINSVFYEINSFLWVNCSKSGNLSEGFMMILDRFSY
jgi:hypothetical protein